MNKIISVKQVWEDINKLLQDGYAPHHIANYFLRLFNVELPPIPIAEILYQLKIDYKITENIHMERFINSYEFGNIIFGQNVEKVKEFAVSLLCPLWMLEPIVIAGKRTARELGNVFLISQNILNIQLNKLR